MRSSLRASACFFGFAITVLAAGPAAAQSVKVSCGKAVQGRISGVSELTYSTDPPSVTQQLTGGPVMAAKNVTYDASKKVLNWPGLPGMPPSPSSFGTRSFDIAGKKLTSTDMGKTITHDCN